MRKYPSISVEYVRVRLYLTEELDTQNPALAIIPTATEEPDTGDWVPAAWLSDDDVMTSSSGTEWHFRDCGILIGPGNLELANGTYKVWWTFTTGSETPARPITTIQIT